MHPYLKNTQHALETLFKGIFHEEQELARLRLQLERSSGEAQALTRSAEEFNRYTDPSDDDEGVGQLRSFEAWEARTGATQSSRGVEELSRSIADKEVAKVALCGSLLQIAKMGITDRTGTKPNVPVVSKPGRVIDDLPLEEIIWGARNQSMHHEEAPKSAITKKVFNTLFSKYGPRYDASQGKDLAREIVDLLGWTSIEKFYADMETILP